MAKVTMYRGIDLMDGQESYLALCNGNIARCAVDGIPRHPFQSKEMFGKFDNWASAPIDDEDRATLANCAIVWEADL
ncbi:MAG: hypothetical protein ACRCYD_00730 [Plesiomonas sp.]